MNFPRVTRLHIVPLATLPKVLQDLASEDKRILNDVLLNDEVSSDEEMADHLTNTCGIHADAVAAAMQYAAQARTDPLFHLFDPESL